jgi:DNA polymerase IV (DinB-like DNA polymerase)
MNRIILHIDMDAFFAQIEERENPHFRGKPVVVGADPKGGKGRGVVSTANYEARKYGIHSSLPISIAWRLYPNAIFLPVNMKLYQEVSEKIIEILKNYSPVVEQVSLDEAYLDLSSQKSYEKTEKLAEKIKAEILEKEKLTSTIGIGPNKTIAKMATNQAKPNGLLVIKPKEVKNFLDPLDIEELPGIGLKTADQLRNLKVNIIKELRRLSKEKLQNLFGKVGLNIYEKARGINKEPVSSDEIIKSIGKEHTFDIDTRDPEMIFGIFEEIIKMVHQELLNNEFSFKTITVICRYSGFETHTKSKTLEKETQNLEILESESKKLLLKFLVEKQKLIRLIGLRLSSLQ